MKNRISYWMVCLVAASVLWGCDEAEPTRFEDTPALYFFRGQEFIDGATFRQNEQIGFTFLDVVAGTNEADVLVDVRTTGFPVNSNRKVTFVQTNAGQPDAAVAGKHYVPFDDPAAIERAFVPANEARALVPITLLRDESLENGKYVLEFEIVSNDFFKPGLSDQVKFTITTTGQYEEPKEWTSWWVTAFGTWGAVKMWFITQVVGFNDMDVKSTTGFRTSMKNRAIEKLNEYNADPSNPTLFESDGTEVLFPGMQPRTV